MFSQLQMSKKSTENYISRVFSSIINFNPDL